MKSVLLFKKAVAEGNKNRYAKAFKTDAQVYDVVKLRGFPQLTTKYERKSEGKNIEYK